MPSNASRTGPVNGLLGRLRVASLITVLSGAGGSVALTLYAGRHNDSLTLVALFAIWVLSPFVALLFLQAASKGWSFLTRAALDGLMIVLAVCSLAIYGARVVWPPKTHAAFVFVVVPPASWLLISAVVPTAGFISGRRSRRKERTNRAHELPH